MSKCGDECKCSDECKDRRNKPNVTELWDNAYRGYDNAPIQEICGEVPAKILSQCVQLDRWIMTFFICLLTMMAFKVIKPEWMILVGVYVSMVIIRVVSYLIVWIWDEPKI